MNTDTPPNEITRDSLVSILEIMHRLAVPEAMPELLREVIEVGKIAIVAEAGVLWLWDKKDRQLVKVVPSTKDATAERVSLGETWAGKCAQELSISNIHECREDDLFQKHPLHIKGVETRSMLNIPIVGQGNALLGVMQWLGAEAGQFDEHDEWIGPTLAAQAAVAIQHSLMTDELLANAILSQEVALARDIQMSTLPEAMPEIEGYDLHGHFQPTDHTGGDLYDVVELEQGVFLLLGDATGHGFGPALSATQMQAMLRVAFRLDANLDRAYQHVNNQLAEDLPDNRFITAFIGFLDAAKHRINYHSGGQGPILHFKAADNSCDWYKPTSFPVGVMEMDEPPQSASLELAEGDILALISDGIYEYENEAGKQFGEQRVAQLFESYNHLPMSGLSDTLLAQIAEFGGTAPQLDDVTLVLVRRNRSD